jgi:hypothetical protein
MPHILVAEGEIEISQEWWCTPVIANSRPAQAMWQDLVSKNKTKQDSKIKTARKQSSRVISPGDLVSLVWMLQNKVYKCGIGRMLKSLGLCLRVTLFLLFWGSC